MINSPHRQEQQVGGRSEQRLVQRLLNNSIAQLATPALRIVLGIALSAVLARYLGVRGFGEYGLVFAYVGLFSGVFNDWGLSTIALREISQRPAEIANILGSAAALQAVIALGSYVVLILGALIAPFPAEVRVAIAIYGLTILFSVVDILALRFQAELRIIRVVPASVLGQGALFAAVLIVVAAHGTLAWIILANFGALMLQWVLIWRLLPGRRSLRVHFPTWRALLSQSWSLGVATIFVVGIQQAPTLLLSHRGLAQVGIYVAASKIPLQLAIIPLILRTSTFPVLSRSWAESRSKFRRQLRLLLGLMGVAGALTALAGVSFSDLLMPILFGRGFGGGARTMVWLMAGAGILMPFILLAESMTAAGRQRFNLVVQASALALLLGLASLLVARYGTAGAAAAVACTYAYMLLAEVVYLKVVVDREADIRWLLSGFLVFAAGFAAWRLPGIQAIGPAGALAVLVMAAFGGAVIEHRAFAMVLGGCIQKALAWRAQPT